MSLQTECGHFPRPAGDTSAYRLVIGRRGIREGARNRCSSFAGRFDCGSTEGNPDFSERECEDERHEARFEHGKKVDVTAWTSLDQARECNWPGESPAISAMVSNASVLKSCLPRPNGSAFSGVQQR